MGWDPFVVLRALRAFVVNTATIPARRDEVAGCGGRIRRCILGSANH
jgi:hypothetical protein